VAPRDLIRCRAAEKPEGELDLRSQELEHPRHSFFARNCESARDCPAGERRPGTERERVFDAVIDKVEVKALKELSPREIEHDNPQIRRVDEMVWFLSQLYNREVAEEEIVTLIRFSQIT